MTRLSNHGAAASSSSATSTAAATFPPVAYHHDALATAGVAVELEDHHAFSIPRHSAGIVIGKGGQTLKDIERDFNCRVLVNKEGDIPGLRVVVVRPSGPPTELPLPEGERDVLRRCQDRILAIVAQDEEEFRAKHDHNPHPPPQAADYAAPLALQPHQEADHAALLAAPSGGAHF